MVELAEIDCEDLAILEPSAGDGALLRALPDGSQVTTVEFNTYRCKKIEEEFGAAPIEEDFLKWQPDEDFDRALMNPPFSDRVEAYHVVKAFTHLKPGGILVAIVPDGWWTRDDLKATVFRTFLQKYEHKAPETLPAGTFGRTRIVTRIVTLKKPGAEGQESAPHAG